MTHLPGASNRPARWRLRMSTPVFVSSSLDQLLTEHVVEVVYRQHQLRAAVGDLSWRYRVEDGTLLFGDAQQELGLPATPNVPGDNTGSGSFPLDVDRTNDEDSGEPALRASAPQDIPASEDNVSPTRSASAELAMERYSFPASVLGTDNGDTFLWAWAAPDDPYTGVPSRLARAAWSVRARGTALGIEELSVATVVTGPLRSRSQSAEDSGDAGIERNSNEGSYRETGDGRVSDEMLAMEQDHCSEDDEVSEEQIASPHHDIDSNSDSRAEEKEKNSSAALSPSASARGVRTRRAELGNRATDTQSTTSQSSRSARTASPTCSPTRQPTQRHESAGAAGDSTSQQRRSPTCSLHTLAMCSAALLDAPAYFVDYVRGIALVLDGASRIPAYENTSEEAEAARVIVAVETAMQHTSDHANAIRSFFRKRGGRVERRHDYEHIGFLDNAIPIRFIMDWRGRLVSAQAVLRSSSTAAQDTVGP